MAVTLGPGIALYVIPETWYEQIEALLRVASGKSPRETGSGGCVVFALGRARARVKRQFAGSFPYQIAFLVQADQLAASAIGLVLSKRVTRGGPELLLSS